MEQQGEQTIYNWCHKVFQFIENTYLHWSHEVKNEYNRNEYVQFSDNSLDQRFFLKPFF